MPELTLESLAARVAELERRAAAYPNLVAPTRDWRTVVGISDDDEFERLMQAEMEAMRDAGRLGVLEEDEPQIISDT